MSDAVERIRQSVKRIRDSIKGMSVRRTQVSVELTDLEWLLREYDKLKHGNVQ